jgi:septal ring-binding cell division protein DamX
MTNGTEQQHNGEFDLNNELKVQPQSWHSRAEFIQHLTLFNNVLMLMLSDSKIERNHFLQLLIDKLDTQIQVVRLSVTNDLSLDTIVRDISLATNLKYIADTPFTNYISQLNERKQHVLVVVEQAELLSEPLLKTLLQAIKSQGVHGYFHTILSTDYSLLEILHKDNYKQFEDLIHSIEISGLNEKEIQAYIKSALIALNAPKELKLSEAEITSLLTKHGGKISVVNKFLLSKIYAKPSVAENYSNSIAKLTKFAATAIPLVVAAIAIGYFMPFQKNNGSLTNDKQATTSTEKLVKRSPIPTFVSYLPQYNLDATIKVSEISAEQTNKEIQTKLMQYSKRQIHHTSSLIDSVVVTPKNLILKSFVAKAPSHYEPVKRINKQKAKTLYVKRAHHKPKHKTIHKLKNNTKQGAYTIQIMATHSLNKLKRYIKNSRLKDGVKVYKTKSKGQQWYVLAIGNYANKVEAKKALTKLSTRLSKHQPWIRSFKRLEQNGNIIG